MPASRSVLADIREFNLDPKKAHRGTGASGHIQSKAQEPDDNQPLLVEEVTELSIEDVQLVDVSIAEETPVAEPAKEKKRKKKSEDVTS